MGGAAGNERGFRVCPDSGIRVANSRPRQMGTETGTDRRSIRHDRARLRTGGTLALPKLIALKVRIFISCD
jgi:hypothetical protein